MGSCNPCNPCAVAAFGETGGYGLLTSLVYGIVNDSQAYKVGLYGGISTEIAANAAATHTPGGGEVANANPLTADYLELQTADWGGYARANLKVQQVGGIHSLTVVSGRFNQYR